MSLAVDTPGEPAHDDQPGRRELTGEAARHLRAVRGAAARADDGNGRLREDIAVPADVEVRGRVVELAEQPRIELGPSRDRGHLHAESSVGER
jgi:hypothetical protein